MRLGQEMSRGGWKLRFDSISVEGAPGAHVGALVLKLTAVHPTEELDPKQLELIDGGGPCPIRSWASSPDSRSSKVVSWTVGLPRADTLSLRFYTAKRGPLRITLSR